MPLSKRGKPYYTQEQLAEARSCSAMEYAKSRGYDLVRESPSRCHLREHDSMIFLADGRWYWNSRRMSGRALDFLVKYEGRPLLDAVLILTNDPAIDTGPNGPRSYQPKAPPPGKKEFVLPERAPSHEWRRLFAYLGGVRKLDQEILHTLIRENRLYLSKYKPVGRQTVYNAAFIGFNGSGQPVSAFLRGVTTKSAFKLEVPGSDKRGAFVMHGSAAGDTLILFESAIDAISHATLIKATDRDWRADHRMATGGNYPIETVKAYLSAHPSIRKVGLAFDNDQAGQVLMAYTLEGLYDLGVDLVNVFPPQGYKDWNEYLQKR